MSTVQEQESPAEGKDTQASDNGDQYLTFIMADEEYGVDILAVQEIRGWDGATPLPNAPPHIKGVINLRGTIVPIVDLRLKFGLPKVDYGPVTVVIILKIVADFGERVLGIVVDAVSDVYSLDPKNMGETPDLGDNVNTAFIKGLATVNDKMVIVLDLERLMTVDDFTNLPDIAKKLKNKV